MVKEKGTQDKQIRVGVSIGDINGIGPEVVIKALNDSRILQDCTPVVYASSKVISYHKKAIDAHSFNFLACKSAEEAKNKKINVVNLWNQEIPFSLGEVKEEGGKYAFESLEAATKDLASGKIDVLVTAPISKEAMQMSGFQFPGHTEYLADMAGQKEALMVMVSKRLRVALVTTHLPLKEVIANTTKERVLEKIKQFEKSLKKDFGCVRPKIAVFGLNPHAGENGKMGEEEAENIIPAINQAKQDGILAFGPYPSDGFFGSAAKNQFDGILAMYHDQGLTGFKALAFEDGVNFTAGLPIVRTSPDHGTAFDIAGKNQASAESMRSAIYLAIDIYKNNQDIKEMNANPLPVGLWEKNRKEKQNKRTTEKKR